MTKKGAGCYIISPGSGAPHACSRDALAKAAASGRALTAPGADFCRLHRPR